RPPPAAATLPLPTYPFQHHPYWLAPTAAGGGPDHPLLGALTELAGQDQVVLTGRLALASQGWLGGHTVAGTVLFPATGFLEVVLRAGDYVACPLLEELVLHTPLTLSPDTNADLQLAVHPPDDTGRRSFTVHSRPSGPQQPGPWTLHAAGTLSPTETAADAPAPAPAAL